MAWQNEMVRLLRYYIGDIDSEIYPDSRLEEIILVASQYIITKVDFNFDYTVDIDTSTLNPDPTTTNPKDNDFINLCTVYAAAIVLKSEAKTLAAQAYRIVDGPSQIDTTAAYRALMETAKEMTDTFEGLVADYQLGNSIGAQAVITPYTVYGDLRKLYTGYYDNMR